MKEILCFGDSNTHGYMPGLGTRYPIDQRWSGLLGKLLGDGYHVVEEGMDGRTTAFEDDLQPWRSALGYIGPCVKTHAPLDLIIIMLGTNDSKTRYGISAEEIGFGMQELIQRIETFFRYNAGRAGACRRSSSSARFPCPRRAATGIQRRIAAEAGRTGCGLQGCGRAVWLCLRGGRGLDHPGTAGCGLLSLHSGSTPHLCGKDCGAGASAAGLIPLSEYEKGRQDCLPFFIPPSDAPGTWLRQR